MASSALFIHTSRDDDSSNRIANLSHREAMGGCKDKVQALLSTATLLQLIASLIPTSNRFVTNFLHDNLIHLALSRTFEYASPLSTVSINYEDTRKGKSLASSVSSTKENKVIHALRE
jgi:hypothetical protein